MAGRSELKFEIGPASETLLFSRLSLALAPDPHAADGFSYTVRSLYFDDPAANAYFDKVAGVENRVKYRIRFYNGDLSFLRLEKKEKRGSVCFKSAETLSPDAARSLLTKEGDAAVSGPLFRELSRRIRTEGFRPLLFVTYQRRAFLHPAGNVRLTLDSQITAEPFRGDLAREGVPFPVLEPGLSVLEVKYDSFLPSFISALLADVPKIPAAVSKFCKAREILS